MRQNTQINLKAISRVASKLGDLNSEAVYVGGAIISIYVDDPSATDVRPTKDIDIVLKITSLSQLEKVRQELNSRGFAQTIEDDVVCRFRLQDLIVDVMSTHQVGWAPANSWFASGFNHIQTTQIDNHNVQILPLSYYLASKFEAYKDRASDPRTSPDFEDIVYLLNYCTNLESEVAYSEQPVQDYLREQFNAILDSSTLQEALLAHLFYEDKESRFTVIIEKLKSVVNKGRV